MAQATKAFDAASVTQLSDRINVYLTANPAFVVEGIAMSENTGTFYAIVAYHT